MGARSVTNAYVVKLLTALRRRFFYFYCVPAIVLGSLPL